MKYCLVDFVSDEQTALRKAPEDVRNVAHSLGFQDFFVNAYEPWQNLILWKRFKIGARLLSFAEWMFERYRIIRKLKAGDFLLIQAPPRFLCRKSGFDLLQNLKVRGVKIIYFVHDIAELRENNLKTLDMSRGHFSALSDAARTIVVHNEAMKKWMIARGVPECKLIVLNVFDYLLREKFECKRLLPATQCNVVIAGNMDIKKSAYLKELWKINGIQWNLYGPNFSEREICKGDTKNIRYYGAFDADFLPTKLIGSFGLVWDGCSIATCDGVTGQYLRYNNPHKLSLYLVSCLPIIIWKEAAEANFVLRHNVGIVIRSLDEIEGVISKISQDEYRRMQNNAQSLSLKLRAGDYIRNALIDSIKDR